MDKLYQRLTKAVFGLSLFFLLLSFYLEFAEDLKPCSLCLMQRGAVAFVCLFSFLELCFKGLLLQKILSFLAWFFAASGVYFSGRQAWLLFLPEEKRPMCSPALDYMIENDFPFSEVMKSLFLGSGDCAQVDWRLLSLPLAYWSLTAFLGLLALLSSRFLCRS